jgi:transcription initiation factor IIE alpha subunit
MKDFDWIIEHEKEKFEVIEAILRFKKFPGNFENAVAKRMDLLEDIIQDIEGVYLPSNAGHFGTRLSRDSFVHKLRHIQEVVYGPNYWKTPKKIKKLIKLAKGSIEEHIERMDNSEYWFNEEETKYNATEAYNMDPTL